MAESLLIINLEYREVQTTGEPCSVCNEPIFSKQYQLFLEPGGETDTKLCQACYECVKE